MRATYSALSMWGTLRMPISKACLPLMASCLFRWFCVAIQYPWLFSFGLDLYDPAPCQRQVDKLFQEFLVSSFKIQTSKPGKRVMSSTWAPLLGKKLTRVVVFIQLPSTPSMHSPD